MYYTHLVATKDTIIPVRVTRKDRAALRRAAGDEPVSAWLRRIGLDEARRRDAAAEVARLLGEARREGFGLPVEEGEALADEAVHAVRAGRDRGA